MKKKQFTDFVTLGNEKIELEKYIATTTNKQGQWRIGSLGRMREPWLRIGTSGGRVVRPYAQQSAKRIGEVVTTNKLLFFNKKWSNFLSD